MADNKQGSILEDINDQKVDLTFTAGVLIHIHPDHLDKVIVMKNYSTIEKKTKEIYIEQHKNYLKDSAIFKRHLESAQDLDTYDLPAEFFKGKTVLDAGCGNSGYFQVAMYNLGVNHVTCLDIGEDWKPELAKILNQHNIPIDFCDYVSGSTTDLPFDNEAFDFVASNGVIMHLETVEMAELAINELSRVARRGGGCILSYRN